MEPKKRKHPYERPVVIKEKAMRFPREILNAVGKKVVCNQCSSCHACR